MLSVLLALVYGFRSRWADTLDGYSMFRFPLDFGGAEGNRELVTPKIMRCVMRY